MAKTYTTKQGQTVDMVCLEHYGRTADVTELVISANPGISAIGPFLPFATKVFLPDAPSKRVAPMLISLWE